MATTQWPSFRRRRQRCPPINPAPPVTQMCIESGCRWKWYADVGCVRPETIAGPCFGSQVRTRLNAKTTPLNAVSYDAGATPVIPHLRDHFTSSSDRTRTPPFGVGPSPHCIYSPKSIKPASRQGLDLRAPVATAPCGQTSSYQLREFDVHFCPHTFTSGRPAGRYDNAG